MLPSPFPLPFHHFPFLPPPPLPGGVNISILISVIMIMLFLPDLTHFRLPPLPPLDRLSPRTKLESSGNTSLHPEFREEKLI